MKVDCEQHRSWASNNKLKKMPHAVPLCGAESVPWQLGNFFLLGKHAHMSHCIAHANAKSKPGLKSRTPPASCQKHGRLAKGNSEV